MKFFFVTIAHKWYVLLAGLRTKAPLWRLIIHDWTKFTPIEYFGYQNHFYGDRSKTFLWKCAKRHHFHSNPHHPAYWIFEVGGDSGAITMPEWAVREMVADWMGASRAYSGAWPTNASWEWLENAWRGMNLNSNTRLLVRRVIYEVYPGLEYM